MKNIARTLKFLGFLSNEPAQVSQGPRTFLNVTSEVMKVKLEMKESDRDLVFMRHIFKIQDPQTPDKKEAEFYSTLVASGKAKNEGHSIMSFTVGVTCGIATRLVLEGKITRPGVLSPITPDIYQPILDKLEERGVAMTEEA